MSGRHQPLNGADSFNDFGPADSICDYCGATIYVGELRKVSMGSISWLCEACYLRGQQRYDEMTAANRILVDAFGGEDAA